MICAPGKEGFILGCTCKKYPLILVCLVHTGRQWSKIQDGCKISCISEDQIASRSGQLILTLSQTTNFRLFLTKRVCRRQF